MKISTRLSVSSSSIASAIFILFGTTIYLFSSNYRAQVFQIRLKERVLITEKIFLEKESFSPQELEKITDQFLHTLPEETEEVILIQEDSMPDFKYNYPKNILADLAENDSIDFESKSMQGTSRIFQVKGKRYLIIVTAIDKVGFQYLSFLKNIIILSVLLGIPFVFLGTFIITKKALTPISKKIDKANSISASNLHQRLNVHSPTDELGKMAIAFNKLLDRLEESFEAQKAFIRNASHEIKNPLTAIMGEAEIALSKSRTNNEYIESLRIILTEAESLTHTVNNLLQLSKVTANEESIQFETIQLDQLLTEIKDGFDFINPDNQIVLEVDDKATNSDYKIQGNTNLLKTAIINLFDNACKFSLNGPVEVGLSRVNNQIQLIIKDSGMGISENDLEKIFTPFYRGNNAMGIKGSGVGLSLSAKIINLHKGTLDVQSKLDKGTIITVCIPN